MNENIVLLSTNSSATKALTFFSNCSQFALVLWAKYVASPHNCEIKVFCTQVCSHVKTTSSNSIVTVFMAGHILREKSLCLGQKKHLATTFACYFYFSGKRNVCFHIKVLLTLIAGVNKVVSATWPWALFTTLVVYGLLELQKTLGYWSCEQWSLTHM
jgi:hypothetical protein